MSESRQSLPPLEWIRVFEAAARLGNFTAAANELGLTQAAVSQRIRNLELRLGAQLFTRQARGVTLSTTGEAWLPHVQAALSQLLHSTANLFEAPHGKIAIAASSSIIELWIVPRLSRIGRCLPHVQLSFETIQHLPDYERSEVDFEIRFGTGSWPQRDAQRLFVEEFAPVASPALLNGRKGNWHEQPLIAVSGPRIGWRDWTLQTGQPLPPVPSLRFDTFAQALRAAEAGAGILLASLALCNAALEAGTLVRLTDQTLRMDAGYWITWPRARPAFPERQPLVDCLLGPACSQAV
ncbi:LysR substrate-binding domain-containing protein [Gluconacetobacter tumulisoli]|uniref:LysR family transcriptional regulator n=1 Tax=Gluconacetobacter tumulisoli TaxID=1286189 RepID=A0A7W4K8Z2_9PROT|nr:LysR substrate-binding domain-containing protein [Gluconacetobacter tumulisoli]MBB2202551.1 LysR family transcriptional regulator [Gluconacetobacter tumulisoli]